MPGAHVALFAAHVGALLVGGGLALSIDRATLARRDALREARRAHVAMMAAAHRKVAAALGVVLATGAALVLVDVEGHLGAWIFWVKLALFALLVANGAVMIRAGDVIRRDVGYPDGAWRRLQQSAWTSIALWIALVSAGVALTPA